MPIYLAIPTPVFSSSLPKALNAVLSRANIHGFVSTQSPAHPQEPIERLCCPVEPADASVTLYIELPDEAAINATLLNVDFVTSCVAEYEGHIPSDDLFVFECLVTSAMARELTIAYLHKTTAKKLMSQAKSSASKWSWVEDKLGTPSIGEMLTGYADDLLARGLPTR